MRKNHAHIPQMFGDFKYAKGLVQLAQGNERNRHSWEPPDVQFSQVRSDRFTLHAGAQISRQFGIIPVAQRCDIGMSLAAVAN